MKRSAAQIAYYEKNREQIRAKEKVRKKAARERYAPKAKAWREANRETVKANWQAWYAANCDRMREEKRAYATEYRKTRRALLVQKSVEYGRKHKGKRHAWSTKWLATHPEYGREHSLRYARALRQATPPWVDKEALERFYDECPEGFHVDHIVPLRGKNVCGLHLAANLQYLLPEDNSRKKNSFDETQALAVSFGV